MAFIPPLENDGILMAVEASDLKLDGTHLVVLSACDTGVGDIFQGETAECVSLRLPPRPPPGTEVHCRRVIIHELCHMVIDLE